MVSAPSPDTPLFLFTTMTLSGGGGPFHCPLNQSTARFTLGLTIRNCVALLRVSVRTVANWEAGSTRDTDQAFWPPMP